VPGYPEVPGLDAKAHGDFPVQAAGVHSTDRQRLQGEVPATIALIFGSTVVVARVV
jgi:hypothetical protein